MKKEFKIGDRVRFKELIWATSLSHEEGIIKDITSLPSKETYHYSILLDNLEKRCKYGDYSWHTEPGFLEFLPPKKEIEMKTKFKIGDKVICLWEYNGLHSKPGTIASMASSILKAKSTQSIPVYVVEMDDPKLNINVSNPDGFRHIKENNLKLASEEPYKFKEGDRVRLKEIDSKPSISYGEGVILNIEKAPIDQEFYYHILLDNPEKRYHSGDNTWHLHIQDLEFLPLEIKEDFQREAKKTKKKRRRFIRLDREKFKEGESFTYLTRNLFLGSLEKEGTEEEEEEI